MENVYFVKNQSSEWDYMWDALGSHSINSGLNGRMGTKTDPTVARYKGESWEYTVTAMNDGEMSHCFRHRNHPKTKQREYVLIRVSENFSVEKDCDINRKPKFQIRKA